MEFYNVLKQLRRQKGVSQEALAEFLGISPQAVSKWECELSYPDIELLPILAEYFKVSIDFLLTGSQSSRSCGFDFDCFADADTLYIVQCKGNKILTENMYDPDARIRIKAEDTIKGLVEIWGSADIEGNIAGDVHAGDSVNCGNVSGDVYAGDGVACGNVARNIFNVGDGINCGNVEGDIVSSHGDIYCHEVKGSINCKRTVYVK